MLLNEDLEYLGDEGYVIEVNQNKIQVEAFHSKGIFWATQTLLQLLPNDILRDAKVDHVKWLIPNCSIEDKPRFAWRGLMIDYSRTFWNKRITKKYIDALAFYKMNKLHMHLTADQGWRIEIDKYPELTESASEFDTSYNEPKEREGYYSKADIREIIAYAKEKNIDIIPEIEMPGHSSEVFSVYPGLSCKGETTEIHPFLLGTGVHNEIFCAGNDEAFVFIRNVLSEIIELFPSKYIHIGGDEAPKQHWEEYDNENNIIMSPNSHCYFDYDNKEFTIEKVYSYNPIPENFNKKQQEKVIGVQANFWSYINRIEPEMDIQIFPRILAMAEVGWSKESEKNWEGFATRLKQQLKKLDVLDIYYYEKE